MANMTVCDVCGKGITDSQGKVRADIYLPNRASVTGPAKKLDIHEHCYSAMNQWMAEVKENVKKFKEVEPAK